MRRRGGRSGAIVAAGLSLAVARCDGGSRGIAPPACREPTVSRTTATAGTGNVLSALISAGVEAADSVVVRFGIRFPLDSVTPAVLVDGNTIVAPVLGLAASTTYAAQLVAYNSCGSSAGDAVPFTTGPLPDDLPTYSAGGSSPSPGYVVFGAGRYGLVIDNTGRVVWYHRFPSGPGLNFQAQPNGRYAARPPTQPGDANTGWIEITPTGTTARSLGCAHGLSARMHDMIAQPNGSYWLMCDEVRTIDLSRQGASSTASVLGTALQHRSASGDVLFEWSAFDHFDVDLVVLEAVDRAGGTINWTHGNAIDLDGSGSLLVSFRNLSEVTKIDTRTGAVVWRMGGERNQIAFSNGDVPAFTRQHGVRTMSGGQLVLLDNLGHARGSRAERYEVDDTRRTARLTGAFSSSAGLVAQVGGTTQSLPGDRTLVSFGNGGGVEEYDAAGNVVWRLYGTPGYIFRAQRIRSLYHPGANDPR